jgi:uncharacterized membrane protein YcaP (DUF421 family)
MWTLYRAPKATVILEGEPSTLIEGGKVDVAEMRRQSLTHEELISVLNKNGFNDPADVQKCVLEPNGTFYVEGKKPSSETLERQRMIEALAALSTEVKALRREIEARG